MVRRLLGAAIAVAAATALAAAPLAGAHAAGALTASGQATHIIGAGYPQTPFDIATGRDGYLVLDATIEQGGSPVAGVAPVHAEGQTSASQIGSFEFQLDGTGLGSGQYQLVGTVTVTASDNSGDYTGSLSSPVDSGVPPTFTVDRDAPDGGVTLSRSYFRPTSNGTYDAVTVTSSGTPDSGNRYISVVDSGGTEVYFDASFAEFPAGTWQTTYDGRDKNGINLPAGRYTLRITDAAGNVGPTVPFTVQHLVTKTFSKTVTAKASKFMQQAGACSSVTSPSTHGWAGSLGLNSNIRCHKTSAASVALTGHQMTLTIPSAVSFTTAQVKAYGGAAKRAAGSRALLFYMKGLSGDVTQPAFLGSSLGTHAGPRVAASTVIFKDSAGSHLVWYVTTGGGARYDLKTFTVTVTYRAWG